MTVCRERRDIVRQPLAKTPQMKSADLTVRNLALLSMPSVDKISQPGKAHERQQSLEQSCLKTIGPLRWLSRRLDCQRKRRA